MKRYYIDSTKPAKISKKDNGIPVVSFSSKEQEFLKTVFDFYIFFPLHSNKKNYVNAKKLFDKINLSVSTLKSKELKIIKK